MSEDDTAINEEQELAPKYDFDNCRTVKTGVFEQADIIAAIEYTMGNYRKIGQLLGKSRESVKRYIESSKELFAFLGDQREGVLDDLESAAISSALRGDTTNQRFFLQTLGKSRGYTTKTESDVTHKTDPSMKALFERIAEKGGRLVPTPQEQNNDDHQLGNKGHEFNE